MRDLRRIAVIAIMQSSAVDFPTLLHWGQWCRDVAFSSDTGDSDRLDQLINEWEAQRE